MVGKTIKIQAVLSQLAHRRIKDSVTKPGSVIWHEFPDESPSILDIPEKRARLLLKHSPTAFRRAGTVKVQPKKTVDDMTEKELRKALAKFEPEPEPEKEKVADVDKDDNPGVPPDEVKAKAKG